MESLPKYLLYRSKRRSIRIVLRSNGVFAVYCPKKCAVKDIEAALSKHCEEMRQRFNARADLLFAPDGNGITLPLFGKRYPVTVGKTRKLVFDGDKFISSASDRETLRTQYRELLRKTAKEVLPSTVSELAEKNGFTYSGLTVKAIYSRYGSCSAKKHLNFSLALMAFDREFISFVILHELCHTVHLDHSAAFYDLLSRVCPDHKRISSEGKGERSVITKAIHFSPA